MSLAAVVIATEKRLALLPEILDSLWRCKERVIVGDFAEDRLPRLPGFSSYFQVSAITNTTIDALMKRDVGWLVTASDAVLFLANDHKIDEDFCRIYRSYYEVDPSWDFLAPARYTIREDQKIWLNNGRADGYVGGHAGVFRRRCASVLPWMAGPHHLNWDLLHARELQQRGLRLRHAEQELAIVDIEPNARPWE